MGKFWSSLKHLPEVYYNWKKLDEGLDTLLKNAESTRDHLTKMDAQLEQLQKTVGNTEVTVNKLNEDVKHINGRLAIIGEGTKMELFDTLYHWKKILVDDRGWASKAEKTEVKAIYEIYHNELGGNGQGEIYYNQILALDENDPANS